MNQTLILALVAVMVGSAGTASAQNETSAGSAEYLPIPGRTLEQRHMECVDDPECSVGERLLLLEEMNDEMDAMIGLMNENCMELDYEDCIDPRSAANEQWHKMHNHSGEMMFSMEINAPEGMGPFMTEYEADRQERRRLDEAAEEMRRQEPAAGTEMNETESIPPETERMQRRSAEEEQKSWWQRLFGDDSEPDGQSSIIEYD